MNGTSPASPEDQRSSNSGVQKIGNALLAWAKSTTRKAGLLAGLFAFLKIMRGEKSKKISSVLAKKTTSAIKNSRKYQTRMVFIWKTLNPGERYIVGLFAIVIVAGLVGLGVQFYLQSTESVPRKGGAYTEAMIGLPRFINPVLAQSNDTDRDIARLLYPSLLAYDEKGNLKPSLAERYEIGNENKDYTFFLRKGATWEDGKPITSADVVFTINLIQDPKYSSPLRQNWLGVVASAKDTETVSFSLASVYVPFPENTTIGILPKHIWENVAPNSFILADANLRPIGGGPYKFERFQKDASGYILSYELRRNELYFGERPFLDGITFRFFDNEDDAIRAYNRKAVDGVSFISALGQEELRPQKHIAIYAFTMPRYFALFLNGVKSPALESNKVRKAISIAINKDEIIEKVLRGAGATTNGPILPFMESYNTEKAQSYKFDPEEAKNLLTSDKWVDADQDGFREKGVREAQTVLEIKLQTVAWPELEEVSRVIQTQLAAVGVKVNLEFLPIGELQQNVIRPREYQALLFGEVLSINPDPFSFWHSSQKKDPGLNLSLYENKSVDKLLEEARQEHDAAKRIEKLKQFQVHLADDIPAVFLYNPSYLYAVNKKVKGISPAIIADPSWRFYNISQWFIETKRVWK